jgi:hypothetical protein
MANGNCSDERQRSAVREWAKERSYRPGSSSTKEGLAARAEKLERIEADEEGLGGIRGIESESEVECIQSNRWSWDGSQTLSLSLSFLPWLRSYSYPTSAPFYSINATRPHLQRVLCPFIIKRISLRIMFYPFISAQLQSKRRPAVALLLPHVLHDLQGMSHMFGEAPQPRSYTMW